MKAIRRMFGEGQGGFVYPFRYVFVVGRDGAMKDAVPMSDGSIEMLFSVPKKFHKRANRRNLLKRRTREAYRLGREELRRRRVGRRDRRGVDLFGQGVSQL